MLLLLALLTVPAPAPDAPTPEQVRAAVEASLVYLQDESSDWIQTHKCATCHHVPMMVWTANEARRRGFTLDKPSIDAALRISVDDPRAGDLLRETKEPPTPENFVYAATFAAVASNSVPADELTPAATLARQNTRAYLLTSQNPDGSWTKPGPSGRPPIAEGQEINTAMTLLGLSGWKDAEAATAGARGMDWLEKTPPKSDQSRLLRLLLKVRRQADRTALLDDIDSTLARQNQDGGWSQAKELPSDAFATGMSVYVLLEAGLEPDHPAIGRALDFLIKTQTDDGNWVMTSRPSGPEDKGAENLRPITFAGSAWATLGLVRALPVPADSQGGK